MKSDGTNIKKNIVFIAVYQVVMWVLPIITTPYISRILEPDGVGVVSYTGSVQYYFSMFAVLGTSAYGSREISMNRDSVKERSQKFWEIELLNLVTSTVCMFVWTMLVLFSEEYKIYYCILSISLFTSLFDITWFFGGLEKFKLNAIQGTVFSIISVVSVFVVLKKKEDLPLYLLVTCSVSFLKSISMWIHLVKYIVRVPIKELRLFHHFKETIIYFVPTFATSIYTVLDKTLIGIITDNRYQNGYYEQAHNVIGIAKQITYSAINTVVGTRIAYLFSKKKMDEVKRLINKSMDYIMLIGFGAMFGIVSIASDFVPLFFGDGYEMSINLIYIMSPLVILISISNCLGSQYYSPVGLRSKSAKYIVVGAVVNLFLNLVLIPIFGCIGAAIGSIVAEFVITFLYLKNCDGIIMLEDVCRFSYKRIIAGAVMLVCALGFKSLIVGNKLIVLIAQIVFAILIYIVMLIVLKDKLFLKVLKSIFKRG